MAETDKVVKLESQHPPEHLKPMKRDRTAVTADVLRVCSTGATKTEIVYQSNINFRILKTYLARLIPAGLLKQDEDGKHYFTTGAGEEFIYHAEKVAIWAV